MVNFTERLSNITAPADRTTQHHVMSKSKGKQKAKAPESKECTMLILTGLPASGKSTFSKELEKAGWVRVNQDDLGTREECQKVAIKAMKHNQSVVIDRCNPDASSRRMWMAEAKKLGVTKIESVYMNTPVDECKRRANERTMHPTLAAGDHTDEVIDSFARQLRAPDMHEGFLHVSVITTGDEFKAEVRKYSAYVTQGK